MQMKQLLIVMRQTFLSRLKTAGYWLLVLTPVLIVAAIAGVVFLMQATQNNTPAQVGVVQSKTLSRDLDQDKALHVKAIYYLNATQAKKALDKDQLDAMLTEKQGNFVLTKRADGQTLNQATLKNVLAKYNTTRRAQQLHLKERDVDTLTQSPKIQTHVQSKKGVNQNGDNSTANYTFAVALGILIFMFLTSYVGMIAQEIANEKSSRIMEILLAATSPGVQFFGKIGGIGLLAALHGLIYVVLGLVVSVYLPKIPQLQQVNQVLQGIDWNFALMTLLIVFVSILLYMVLTAIVAAMVNDLSQVQQAVAPVTYLSMFGYVLTFLINGQPHNVFLNVVSYLPFFSQTLMPARLGLQYASMPEAWIALGLEVVALYLLAKYGLRVYKQNVLTYREGNITKIAWMSLKGLFKS
ncbi:ABC-2 type transport system permease protein [Weissella uvarum]|uniref:ABC transporter permease n=1 Tax=Weissella uvarum TaxID=1479233 RepID=UPI00195FF468|nr:ABC transporter permease [Weissella uvarum]MBM7618087.1 ABC-2 type transport system permease protein [Weissella uvarum]MCM0595926.1 ABC transporter permease [Weissella uvarum]